MLSCVTTLIFKKVLLVYIWKKVEWIHDKWLFLQGWKSQKELHRPSKRSPRSTSRTRTWWWSVAVTLLPNRPWPGTRTPRSWCRGPATRCAPPTKEMTTHFTLIFWWAGRYLARNYPHAYFVLLNFDSLNCPGFPLTSLRYPKIWDIRVQLYLEMVVCFSKTSFTTYIVFYTL